MTDMEIESKGILITTRHEHSITTLQWKTRQDNQSRVFILTYNGLPREQDGATAAECP